jgi:hypothetical protein
MNPPQKPVQSLEVARRRGQAVQRGAQHFQASR